MVMAIYAIIKTATTFIAGDNTLITVYIPSLERKRILAEKALEITSNEKRRQYTKINL